MKAQLAFVGIVAVAVVMVAIGLMFQPLDTDDIKKFSSYSELQNYVGSAESLGGFFGASKGAVESMSADSSEGTAAPSDFSTTNIQVAGVDEADIVKSDGEYFYIVSGGKVVIMNAYPPETAEIISEISDPDHNPREVYINGDKLVIFTEGSQGFIRPLSGEDVGLPAPSRYTYEMFIRVYDVSDRSSPILNEELSIEGFYRNSRMIGDYVYTIVNTPVYGSDDIPIPVLKIDGTPVESFPDIYYFDGPAIAEQFSTIISLNLESGESDTSSYLTSYSDSLYSSQDNMYIVNQKRVDYQEYQDRAIEVVLSYLPLWEASLMREALASGEWERIQEAGVAVENYVSTLPESEVNRIQIEIEQKYQEINNEFWLDSQKTEVRRFSLNGLNVEHVATGEVIGYVLNQFSMDEFNGYFRIATTTDQPFLFSTPMLDMGAASTTVEVLESEEVSGAPEEMPPPPPTDLRKNNVYVLDMDLSIVGSLEDLAPGESIFSARFMGNRLYLVTFERVDPLFVIDLSSPSSPQVLGKLKIPGFSDYLHPYDENHIIGVGKDVPEDGPTIAEGVKLSLFDVSDVANPKEISKYIIGERWAYSQALYDHRAFLFSKEKNLLVIPIQLSEGDKYSAFQGAYVFSLDIENGFDLRGRITHAEEEDVWFYLSNVQRSHFIGDVLYTFSTTMVKANSLEDLSELVKVDLPYQEGDCPICRSDSGW